MDLAAGSSRRSSNRVVKPVQRLANSAASFYDSKYLLFFIRKTRTYHNFSRGSLALSHNEPDVKFIFGEDYPLALKDGIFNGMFIAAEPWSKMIYLEKELDAFITENKENSELSDHVQSHMKVFMRQQEDSSDEDAGDIDDSDDDETWQPTPPPTQVSFVSPSPVSTPTAAHSRARKQSQGSLANKRPRTAGTHVEDRHQNSEASLALIASEEQRALPPELLPQVLQAHESAKAASANDPTNSKPLTLAEFQEGMDSLKRFIAHKLRKIRTSSSSLHQMVSADFLKEEFEGHDGRVCNFSDLPRTTTSKFIRAYASARYGVEYVQSHVFGEYKGTTQRPKAPGEVQDHLKSILNKAFNIPRDQTVSAWTAVKDSLNRLGPESTFRKRKAGD